jgi:hypothetical protein
VGEDVYVLNDCRGGLDVAGLDAQRDRRGRVRARAAWDPVHDEDEDALWRVA